jgi:hypothetical protein
MESGEIAVNLERSKCRRCYLVMAIQPIFPASLCLPVVALALFMSPSLAAACTVFTITDGQRVLFCDNEDFSNPRTRMWFVPGSNERPEKYGCVYLGFDDGWGQNGCNERGLAYGWVGGFKEKWERQPEMEVFDGKPCHRMLASWGTVEEAIAFFETHWEESFSYGRLLVADRTGKSVILRAKDGKLHAPIVERSQGMGHRFGMRGDEATPLLAKIAKPEVAEAARLLEFTPQEGVNATKYSVVFDLQSGGIWLYRFPERPEPVKLRLMSELEKGAHYFEIPEIERQLKQPLKGLKTEMKKE